MGSEISNITVNITTDTPISQAGFGKLLLVGTGAKGETVQLQIGAGTAGLLWSAKTAGTQYIRVEYLDPAQASQSLSVTRSGSGTQSSPYLITVSLATDAGSAITSTASDIKAAAEAVANVAGASGIVTVALVTAPGDGVVSASAAQSLGAPSNPNTDLIEVTDADQLIDAGYASGSEEVAAARAFFAQDLRPDVIAVFQISSWANLATEVAALRNAGHDDWYHFAITSHAKADIDLAVAYISSLTKCAYFATSDQTILDEAPQERVAYMITNSPAEYPDLAWVGRCAPATIGSIAWDSKKLNGISNSGVTMSEQTTLLSKNGNLVRSMGGVLVTWPGVTHSGQFIDVLHGKDKLRARLIEAYQYLKVNSAKVPMDMRGLGMVEAAFRSVFRQLGADGVIAPVKNADDAKNSDMKDFQYQLFMPASIADIPAADRALRLVTGISFRAVIGGGINTVVVNGSMVA